MYSSKTSTRSSCMDCSQDTCCGPSGLRNFVSPCTAALGQGYYDHAGGTGSSPKKERLRMGTKSILAYAIVPKVQDLFDELFTMPPPPKNENESPADQTIVKRKASEVSDIGSPAKRAKTQSPPAATAATKVVQFPEKVCALSFWFAYLWLMLEIACSYRRARRCHRVPCCQ
jgi:hypothetical protein